MSTSFIILCPQISGVILLVAVTGIGSGAEAALFSLSRSKVLSFRNSSDLRARRIFFLMEEQHRTLITLIFCKMLFVTLTVMLTGNILEKLALTGMEGMALSALTGLVLVTFCSEIFPMTWAYNHSVKWAKNVATPVFYASWSLRGLTLFVDRFCARFRITDRTLHKKEALSPEEYISYIDLCEKCRTFSKAEAHLLRETLELRTKTVESVMRNRSDLCYVTVNDTPETVRQISLAGFVPCQNLDLVIIHFLNDPVIHLSPERLGPFSLCTGKYCIHSRKHNSGKSFADYGTEPGLCCIGCG